jgi:DNA-binding transcriptional LysR family regulator
METRFLETLVMVADHGSVAEAARRLHLTPAAVSQRLRVLEFEFGVRLVARNGRIVRLSEAGLAVYAHAKAVLREIRDLRAIALSDQAAGEFRLGAISTSLTGLLPDILSRTMSRYPRLEIYVMPGTSSELYPKVLSGELDAAILLQPDFPLPKSCGWHLLRQEPLVVIAAGALAGQDPNALLRSEPFIRYDRNHWGGRLADAYLKRVGIKPNERFELDSLEAIAVLVNRGLGVSLVPDWAPPWPEGLQIHKWRVHPSMTRKIGMVWSRGSPRLRAINALLAETTVPRSQKRKPSSSARSQR